MRHHPMQRLDTIVSDILFGLLSMVALLAPWMFGAWETWWFWPFMVIIYAAGACYAVRLILSANLGTRRLNFSTMVYSITVLWLPFLAYALIRTVQSEVRMDAERSFLLQASPLLLGLMVATGLAETRQRLLLAMIMINLGALGLYGILNHVLADNARVLWVPGFAQYQSGYLRATGSYFCPDHFSGLMEITLGMALPLLLLHSSTRPRRVAALLLAGIALAGIFLSRSRGGGIVAGILIIASLWIATLDWPTSARRKIRATGLGTLILMITALCLWGGHYAERFKQYPWSTIEHSDRYQMSTAALRAWKTAPLFGVGPGMHPNLWPHFAPSPDGNRATGVWPKSPNHDFHSFEAHNDWAQLLEEYGLFGFTLFLLALGTATVSFARRWRRWSSLSSHLATSRDSLDAWTLPGILLAGIAMAIHSMGDFNLQIPATTWLLGILAGLAAAMARHTPPYRKSKGGSFTEE